MCAPHCTEQPASLAHLPSPAGLRVFDTLGGPAAIEAHVEALGRYLYEQASQHVEVGSAGWGSISEMVQAAE